MKLADVHIAELAWEANRLLCQMYGDHSQRGWVAAPTEAKAEFIALIGRIRADGEPEAIAGTPDQLRRDRLFLGIVRALID